MEAVEPDALSELHGVSLEELPHRRIAALADVLREAAGRAGSQGIVFIQAHKQLLFVSYRSLFESARQRSAWLRLLVANRTVILQFCDNVTFIDAFWSVVLSGGIPAPMASVSKSAGPDVACERVAAILATVPGSVVMADNRCRAVLLARLPTEHHPRVILHDDPEARGETSGQYNSGGAGADYGIMLQTSGSTGKPKFIYHTEARILDRTRSSVFVNNFNEDDVSLNFFPLDHVCGILMCHIKDVFVSCRQVIADIECFLADPKVFVDWVVAFQITVTWGTNSAYGLILAAKERWAPKGPDLSSLRLLENCAEAVVPAQANLLMDLLRHCGVPVNAMRPCWGMSETCSVTVSATDGLVASSPDSPFASVGTPYPGISLRVVDEAGRLVPIGTTGHVQVRGPLVFDGYFDSHQSSNSMACPYDWFDTGDTGYIDSSGLRVVGRTKDLLIVNGRNIGAHDIEWMIERLDGVSPSFTAVVPVRDSHSVTEAAGIFFSSVLADAELPVLVSQIRQLVTANFGLEVAFVHRLDPSECPKTSVGKIQKSALPYPTVLSTSSRPKQDSKHAFPAVFEREWVPKRLDVRPPVLPACNIVIIPFAEGVDAHLVRSLADVGRVVVDEPSAGTEVSRGGFEEGLPTVLGAGTEEAALVMWEIDHCTMDARLVYIDRCVRRLVSEFVRLPRLSSILVTVISTRTASAPTEYGLVAETVAGALASLRAERPILVTKIVCVFGLHTQNRIASLIREEAVSLTGCEEVLYLEDERYVAHLVPDLAVANEKHAIRPVQGEVAVVTGGLGGIGLLVSKHLLSSGHSVLITGRQREADLPAERKSNISRLETDFPNRVQYCRLRFTDYEVFSSDLSEGLEALGLRAGLFIHLASEQHWAPSFSALTQAPFFEVFNAKVLGSLHAVRWCREASVAKLVLFSSVVGYLGSAAAIQYGMASRFVSGLSNVPSAEARGGTKLLSIAWSQWNGTGMSRGQSTDLTLLHEARGMMVLEPSEALSVLSILLRDSEGAKLVGYRPAEERTHLQTSTRRHEGSDQADLEMGLCEVWSNTLMRPDLTPESNIFEAGATSSLLILGLARIVECWSEGADIALVFSNPTARLQAQALIAQRPGVAE